MEKAIVLFLLWIVPFYAERVCNTTVSPMLRAKKDYGNDRYTIGLSCATCYPYHMDDIHRPHDILRACGRRPRWSPAAVPTVNVREPRTRGAL